MEVEKELSDSVFYSPTKGQMTFEEVIEEIVAIMAKEPQKRYEIVVGTDCHDTPIGEKKSPKSEQLGSQPPVMDFVSAIIIHRIGKGARYFWRRSREEDIYTLREKIYREAYLSFELAQAIMRELQRRTMLDFNLEIHVDVGERGRTRELIDEVVGYIRASGFAVKTKPDSYGASTVADKHA